MSSVELYQKLYDNKERHYGVAAYNRCPGVRHIPRYKHWLRGNIIDIGCGTGDTVNAVRALGFVCSGIDQISNNPDMIVGDVTIPIEGIDKFDTAVCMDVVEHILDGELKGMFDNLSKVKRQVISIHNGPSTEGHGIELHVNRKPFEDWRNILSLTFNIKEEIELQKVQHLYLCEF